MNKNINMANATALLFDVSLGRDT